MDSKILLKKASLVFDRWNQVEAKRQIYGLEMAQTKAIVSGFFKELNSLLSVAQSFFIVKKEQDFEIVPKDSKLSLESIRLKDIHVNVTFLDDYFTRMALNSLTFYKGITEKELNVFLNILNMSQDAVRDAGGLRNLLIARGVSHIKVDEMTIQVGDQEQKFSFGGDSISMEDLPPHISGDLGGLGSDTSGDGVINKKMFNSSWEFYLGGKMGTKEFQICYKEIIDQAQKHPEHLMKIIENLARKQKEVESFLANLEQKLFELGFPPDAVKNLKEKLQSPGQVTISEDELLRLKKLEEQFEDALDERIEETVKTMTKIQRRLSDERERTEAILRHISQGGIVIDKQGKILALNPVAQKVLGVNAIEAQGKTLSDIVGNNQMVSMVSKWQDETDEYLPKKVELKSPDEATVDTIRESSLVIEDEDGKPLGVISSLQNSVEHQEMEARKNSMLDVLGHDLKVPIGAAKFNLSMILDDEQLFSKFDERQKKFLTKCMKGIEMSDKMVKKILDARRLETGKIILKKEDVDLSKIVEEAAFSLESWAQDKKISLEVDVKNIPVIKADPERIYQIIINYISNALKFTSQEGVIKIKGVVLDIDGQEFVEVSVSDSGIGIEGDDLERVFDKYEQVSLKAPEGVSGLGLGLAICKAIAQLHGGKVRVESEVDKGSTFFFTLPVNEREE